MSTDAPVDVDRDGMPDDWESTHGLNPNNPEDRNNDLDGDGYTNLEEYLNSITDLQAAEYPGDFNGDLRVDFTDFIQFAQMFDRSKGEDGFDPIFDFDGSGKVDFPDFITFANSFNVQYISRS
jgi:hypothetical protein